MFDLLTVVYKEELPLLKIQAQSIEQYINPSYINSITVVINDDDSVAEQIDSMWYGFNAEKLNIKCYSRWNYKSRITGWENQQLCKLLAASESSAPWTMILDAKTWFANLADINLLFTNNRYNSGLGGISPHFVSSQQFVEQLYNISMPHIVGPSGVPFVVHTDTVKELVSSIDNFIEFFQTNVKHPNLITEFHLYSGFVIKKYGSLELLYNIKTPYYNQINLADWESDQFDQAFEFMQKPNALTVSIHRRAYPKLTPVQLSQWQEFLISRRLTQSINDLTKY